MSENKTYPDNEILEKEDQRVAALMYEKFGENACYIKQPNGDFSLTEEAQEFYNNNFMEES